MTHPHFAKLYHQTPGKEAKIFAHRRLQKNYCIKEVTWENNRKPEVETGIRKADFLKRKEQSCNRPAGHLQVTESSLFTGQQTLSTDTQ